jgi:uncharacterized protein with beta-barrel porin domain
MIMKFSLKQFALYSGLSLILAPGLAYANLLDLVDDFSTDLEKSTARGVWQTYNDLLSLGCGNGNEGGGSSASASSAPSSAAPLAITLPTSCTGATLALFNKVSEIIDTANAITGEDVSTPSNLDLDEVELGKALQWNAVEEYNAQSSLTGDFLQSQMSGLSSRISALRSGASFGTLNPANIYQGYAANNFSGSGAAADDDAYSRLGGFINYSGSSGDKAPTPWEDAFDVDGYDLTLGADYRFNSEWIGGVVLGLTNQEIDFDSSKSVVDGGIESEGYSLMPFAIYQQENMFISLSLGYQVLSFETVRNIQYASGVNSSVADTDSTVESSNDSNVISFTGEWGYNYIEGAFSAEPFLKINFNDTSIDAFIERDVTGTGLDLDVSEQSFDSLESSAGLRFRYTFTPSAGVITPYLNLQSIHQYKNNARTFSARYANSATADKVFQLSSEKLDDQYYAVSYGISSVLRGGRQSEGDGAIGGGVQMFIQYKQILELDHYDLSTFTLGIRYEF